MTTSVTSTDQTKALLSQRQCAIIVLLFTPALLCSNMIVAKAVADTIPPFSLAFSRWLAAVLVLLPFIGFKLYQVRDILAQEWRQLLMLGVLGMGICGAFPYIGAHTTSANNIGLIYALSPIFVIIFARILYAVQMNKRQMLGVVCAFSGVVVIVAKGDVSVITSMSFSVGDLWILAATASWGFYSLWQGHLKSKLSLYLRFTAMSIGGVLALLPFALMEVYQQSASFRSANFLDVYLLTIPFLAIVSSIIAYGAYAYIIKILGASKASLVMYAIPLYNAAMAWAFLNEALEIFHFLGAALILPGLFLAVSRNKPKAQSQKA